MTSAAIRKSDSANAAPMVDGEFHFTSADFTRIKDLLEQDSGIHLPDSKATLVYSRLAKRVRLLGLESFAEYCDLVEASPGSEERLAMMAALTTNVTRFFREPHHFDYLRARLPAWIDQARGGAKLRIWSAGCSSGQEPYCIAMVLLSMLPEAAELDVKILASDIDPVIVRKAREGIYSDDLIDGIPDDLRRTSLKRHDQGWRIDDHVRRLVTFNELNLMGEWPMKGRFQVIFCRNVAIYFEPVVQERLWGRFAERLTPDGRLYIGHSERAMDQRFESDGLTAYRLRGAPA